MKRRDFLMAGTALGVGAVLLPKQQLFANLFNTTATVNQWSFDAGTVYQFQDKGLAVLSYAVINNNKEMLLVDPERNPTFYEDLAKTKGAKITHVIETHPHADFVSSHAEMARKHGATILTSKLAGADYPHQSFDSGDELSFGGFKLEAQNTPGHSPDGISIILKDGTSGVGVFTGDTLFVGNVGRPDLREKAGHTTADATALAGMMYETVQEKIWKWEDQLLVWPTHGAGSLCGKDISNELYSNMKKEKAQNKALNIKDKDKFIKYLTQDPLFIPAYFSLNVQLNKAGAPNYQESLDKVATNSGFDQKAIIIDTEGNGSSYWEGGWKLSDGLKFETWLGTVVRPNEDFIIKTRNAKLGDALKAKVAKIGYEQQLKAVYTEVLPVKKIDLPALDQSHFKQNQNAYQIIDVREKVELAYASPFENSKHIPLSAFRENLDKIDLDQPTVIHCASGYRSGLAQTMLMDLTAHKEVYDLGSAIRNF